MGPFFVNIALDYFVQLSFFAVSQLEVERKKGSANVNNYI